MNPNESKLPFSPPNGRSRLQLLAQLEHNSHQSLIGDAYAYIKHLEAQLGYGTQQPEGAPLNREAIPGLHDCKKHLRETCTVCGYRWDGETQDATACSRCGRHDENEVYCRRCSGASPRETKQAFSRITIYRSQLISILRAGPRPVMADEVEHAIANARAIGIDVI